MHEQGRRHPQAAGSTHRDWRSHGDRPADRSPDEWKDGQEKIATLRARVPTNFIEDHYQEWYTQGIDAVRQLAPTRLDEFISQYRRDPKRKTVGLLTYTLEDWLQGIRATKSLSGEKYFEDADVAISRLQTQVGILRAARAQLDSSLKNIREIVQADLLDSELDKARALEKAGFLRAAGALAGVALEHHLAAIADAHGVKVKTKPTIATYNDALKDAQVLGQAEWRFIQRLGDIRNLCDHKAAREPRPDEITDLIDGVDKVTKTIS